METSVTYCKPTDDVRPNITGYVKQGHGAWSMETTGSFSKVDSNGELPESQKVRSGSYFDFDASRCSALYQSISTVQPAALRALPCIKF